MGERHNWALVSLHFVVWQRGIQPSTTSTFTLTNAVSRSFHQWLVANVIFTVSFFEVRSFECHTLGRRPSGNDCSEVRWLGIKVMPSESAEKRFTMSHRNWLVAGCLSILFPLFQTASLSNWLTPRLRPGYSSVCINEADLWRGRLSHGKACKSK